MRISEIHDLKFAECPIIIFKWGQDKEDGLTIDLNNFTVLNYMKDVSNNFFLLKSEPKYFALMANSDYRWQDIYLSLREKVTEKPATFNNFNNIFLFSDTSNIRKGFLSTLNINNERITKINPHTKKKFTMTRYCPHNGGDLINAEINENGQLICPRHGWKFDLNNNGKCIANNASIKVR